MAVPGKARKGLHWQPSKQASSTQSHSSSGSSSKFSKKGAKAGQQPETDHMSVQMIARVCDVTVCLILCILLRRKLTSSR